MQLKYLGMHDNLLLIENETPDDFTVKSAAQVKTATAQTVEITNNKETDEEVMMID